MGTRDLLLLIGFLRGGTMFPRAQPFNGIPVERSLKLVFDALAEQEQALFGRGERPVDRDDMRRRGGIAAWSGDMLAAGTRIGEVPDPGVLLCLLYDRPKAEAPLPIEVFAQTLRRYALRDAGLRARFDAHVNGAGTFVPAWLSPEVRRQNCKPKSRTPDVLDTPVVVVHNYLESFIDSATRMGKLDNLMERRFHGDQALFWCGTEKLLITSYPIENAQKLKMRWGYENTQLHCPDTPSAELCLDIIKSPRLRKAIVERAGIGNKIAMISYAATPQLYQLAETLEKEEGLSVALPQTPRREDLWFKQYIDTKLGFRIMVADWFGERQALPRGFVTTRRNQIHGAMSWFADQKLGCVIKADEGTGGRGNLLLPYERLKSGTAYSVLLQENQLLHDGVCVVEELIESPEQISPSLEYYVPRAGTGSPELLYLCNQHFEESGHFAGVVIGRELRQSPWSGTFKKAGLKVAEQLQAMGYVGYFDLDAIVDSRGRVYLVEINPRRTGGTYAHEFLQTRYGSGYADEITVLSQNRLETRFRDMAALESALDGLLYPINGKEAGIIIMTTSTLFKGDFGFVALGDSIKSVTALRRELMGRV